jgi:hypothetical protein
LNSAKQILFIHIPKCAGVSLFNALEKQANVLRVGPHAKAVNIFCPKGGRSREDTFTFTFTRNPWDRLVSTYFYIMKGGRAPIDKRRRETILRKYRGDFRAFVNDIESWINITEEDSRYPDQFIPHFRPQVEFIYDDQGTCLVDFIGSFENLQEDFTRLCALLQVSGVKLQKSNKSSHRHYSTYYDDQTRDIVAQYYEDDIRHFSYTFEEQGWGLSYIVRRFFR